MARTKLSEDLIDPKPQTALPYRVVAMAQCKTTSPVGIDQGFGIASVTAPSGGASDVTFTTAQPDTDYMVFITPIDNGTRPVMMLHGSNKTTTGFEVIMTNYSGAGGNAQYGYNVMVVRFD